MSRSGQPCLVVTLAYGIGRSQAPVSVPTAETDPVPGVAKRPPFGHNYTQFKDCAELLRTLAV
jgi:hypothetical protein